MYQLCKTSDKSIENYHKNKKNKFIIIVVNFAINGQPQVICHSCMFSSGCQEQDLIGHFQSHVTLESALLQESVWTRVILESRKVATLWFFLETLVKLGYGRKKPVEFVVMPVILFHFDFY